MLMAIAAAVITRARQVVAYLVTDSVDRFSDAAESVINPVAGPDAFVALTLAARPADKEHAYGHTKAAPSSSRVAGTLLLVP